MNWTKLTSESQLDQIDTISNENPVVIYKHSFRCSIASLSWNRIEKNWPLDAERSFFIDVVADRALSQSIASRYETRHESPQILIIKGGKSVYDESHTGINLNQIEAALGS